MWIFGGGIILDPPPLKHGTMLFTCICLETATSKCCNAQFMWEYQQSCFYSGWMYHVFFYIFHFAVCHILLKWCSHHSLVRGRKDSFKDFRSQCYNMDCICICQCWFNYIRTRITLFKMNLIVFTVGPWALPIRGQSWRAPWPRRSPQKTFGVTGEGHTPCHTLLNPLMTRTWTKLLRKMLMWLFTYQMEKASRSLWTRSKSNKTFEH